MRPDEQKAASGKPPARPMFEWIMGVASALLVVVLLAYLGYLALFAEMKPAQLDVSIAGVRQGENGTTVDFVVSNLGDEAAASVKIQAVSQPPSPPKQASFDYVAGQASESGSFVFAGLLTADDISITVESYIKP